MRSIISFTQDLVMWLSIIGAGDVAFAGKPGGATNEVQVAFDPITNTVVVTGNETNNYVYITIDDGLVDISSQPWGQTKVNGLGQITLNVGANHLSVVVALNSGNDVVWLTIGTAQSSLDLSVSGGDGADEVAVFHATRPFDVRLNGDLTVNGGKGDDLIQLGPIAVTGDMLLDAWDGNDDVTVAEGAVIVGTSAIGGGKGRDQLILPAALLAVSSVTGFETTVTR